MYRNETLKAKYPNAGLEAVKAFKKAFDLNDPKFKDWQDTYTYLSLLSTDMYNGGVEMYNAKNYAQAYLFFYSIKDLNAVINGKGMKTIVNPWPTNVSHFRRQSPRACFNTVVG